MKITIYTISDCYFSKQEKEYLQSHTLPFEERNLEENREYLTEMLTVSNNFAGTPVTKIEKDDGQIVVLKGFTEDEFNKTFGYEVAPVTQDTATSKIVEAEIVTQPTVQAPVVAHVPASIPKSDPVPLVAVPQVAVAPVVAPPAVDLGSIAAQIEQLKKLQESLVAQAQKPVPVVAPSEPQMPTYQAPPVQPVAPSYPPVVATPPTPVSPQPTAVTANVDDSLAAILAELQTKINSSQPAAPVTSPTTN